jgi:hypothetical protein
MKLAQARKIAKTVKDDPKWARDYLSTDDLADAFGRLDYNANRNWNDGDKELARTIWDFHA